MASPIVSSPRKECHHCIGNNNWHPFLFVLDDRELEMKQGARSEEPVGSFEEREGGTVPKLRLLCKQR